MFEEAMSACLQRNPGWNRQSHASVAGVKNETDPVPLWALKIREAYAAGTSRSADPYVDLTQPMTLDLDTLPRLPALVSQQNHSCDK
jgi:hypothetical protein